MTKRYCELKGEAEVALLEEGMDFREPRYRREVFHRFYEFHLKNRSHPGCVYFIFPALASQYSWTNEDKLWFAYINGNTQNPITSWLIWREFPSFKDLNTINLAKWFEENYERFAFDTDRRYHKKSFITCVENYVALVGKRTQEEFFAFTPRPKENFNRLWERLSRDYIYFGRLSLFSYLEYLAVMGFAVECSTLFLQDLAGSKSHRNGLCKVLGRDDLDWHDSNPSFRGYTPATIGWLEKEGAALVAEATAKHNHPDVGYFTLESALCTYKSWHRPNRRYPNVYADMLVERIKLAESRWGDLPIFWEIRREALAQPLRLEDNPKDPGVKPVKQNHYRLTGQVIMMDEDCGGWRCFDNDFNRKVRS